MYLCPCGSGIPLKCHHIMTLKKNHNNNPPPSSNYLFHLKAHHNTVSKKCLIRVQRPIPWLQTEEQGGANDFYQGLLSAVCASISEAGALPCLASQIQSMPSWPPVATMCCWFGCLATQCRGTLSPALGDKRV